MKFFKHNQTLYNLNRIIKIVDENPKDSEYFFLVLYYDNGGAESLFFESEDERENCKIDIIEKLHKV